jgi:hypothetical protein
MLCRHDETNPLLECSRFRGGGETLQNTRHNLQWLGEKWTVEWNIDSRQENCTGGKENVECSSCLFYMQDWNKANTQPALDETETKTKQPID